MLTKENLIKNHKTNRQAYLKNKALMTEHIEKLATTAIDNILIAGYESGQDVVTLKANEIIRAVNYGGIDFKPLLSAQGVLGKNVQPDFNEMQIEDIVEATMKEYRVKSDFNIKVSSEHNEFLDSMKLTVYFSKE